MRPFLLILAGLMLVIGVGLVWSIILGLLLPRDREGEAFLRSEMERE